MIITNKKLFIAFALLIMTGCKEQVDSLIAGPLFNCATHGGEVSCWGLFADFRGSDVEALGWELSPLGYIRKKYENPKVSVGYKHFCVLDQSQVECFLDNEQGQTDVPDLQSPYDIAAGKEFSCALDDTGLVCWGKTGIALGRFGNLPDTLDSPTDLVAGSDHICVKDAAGFYCNGFTWIGDGDPTPPEFITNPSKITVSAGTGITCALQDEWTCWTDSASRYIDTFFDSPNADLVVPGIQQTCSLTDGSISCIGNGAAGPIGIDVPERAANARDLDIAGVHACAVNGFGVTCWGPEILGVPLNVPPYL